MTKLAALLLATSLAGCLCGGYSGGGDQVFQRNTDVLILCDNGAFVLDQSGVETDGMANSDPSGTEVGTLDDTAQVVFTLTVDHSTNSASAPELPGTWASVSLDMVALDHANLQCSRLTQATWWPK